MKKISSIFVLFLLIFSITLGYGINNTFAETSNATKKVTKYKYVKPYIESGNVKDINEFTDFQTQLINQVGEKKAFIYFGCKYLDIGAINLDKVLSVTSYFNGTFDNMQDKMNANMFLGFDSNKDIVCGKGYDKMEKGVNLFKDFITLAKDGNPKLLIDFYGVIGDSIYNTLNDIYVKPTSIMLTLGAEGNPVIVSYLTSTGAPGSDMIQTIAGDTKKYDVFTAPLHGCYLTSHTKNDMMSCLKTFVITIKNNTTITTKNKIKIKTPAFPKVDTTKNK